MEHIMLFFLLGQIVWQNTGELMSATQVYAITQGINGYIFAGTKAGLSPGTLDSGWVFVSQDLWSWQPCTGLDGEQEGVFSLINGADDTLFAGTGMWGDLPMVYKSSDGGLSWDTLNNYGTYRPGSRVTAFFEDNLGILHLGNDHWGMSAAIPRHSLDRGANWLVDSGTINYNSQHYNFFQSTDGTMYFGSWGTGGGVHRSSDNGAHWYPATAFPRGTDSYTFVEPGIDTIMVGCGDDTARIYMTTDKGVTWTRMGAGEMPNATRVRAMFIDSRGYLFAGTSPNAEVFVSYDNGLTWHSTGTLSGATSVYEFIEVHKTVRQIDSFFVYAATGPNGDVFRSFWYIMSADEHTDMRYNSTFSMVIPNPFVKTTRISGSEHELFAVYNLAGAIVAEQRGDCVGMDLAPGIYFIKQKTGTGGMIRIVKVK